MHFDQAAKTKVKNHCPVIYPAASVPSPSLAICVRVPESQSKTNELSPTDEFSPDKISLT